MRYKEYQTDQLIINVAQQLYLMLCNQYFRLKKLDGINTF